MKAKNDHGPKSMYELFIRKLDEIEKSPGVPWLIKCTENAPYCSLEGICYPAGSTLLLDISMQQKQYQIPVFGSYLSIQKFGLSFKPNQHGIPIPKMTAQAINKNTGKRILTIEYDKLTSAEKEDYTLFVKSDIQYVFNVEQTNIEKVKNSLWDEWKEHYNYHQHDTRHKVHNCKEMDELIEKLRTSYIGYFSERPDAGPRDIYYSKCAQALAYIAYKALPATESYRMQTDNLLALLYSEITGAFICTKYGLHNSPNDNFIKYLPEIKQKIISQSELIPSTVGIINRISYSLEQVLSKYRDNTYYANKVIKSLDEYMERSREAAKRIVNIREIPKISISSILKKKGENQLSNNDDLIKR